ncbi:MAG: ATP synthase F1 subunit epsilon [Blastocatellia bacterium]
MLKLEIVTPEKRVLVTEAEEVVIPTASGEAGILTDHAPLISELKPGILSYFGKNASARLVVAGGFVEVSDNRVAVLTDSAFFPEEIDLESARSLRDAAEKQLAISADSPENREAAQAEREFAEALIKLAERK